MGNVQEGANRVFRYIVYYKMKHDGNSPSYREIMAGAGVSSSSMVSFYLDELVKAGRVRLSGEGAFRRIEVVGGRWGMKAGGAGGDALTGEQEAEGSRRASIREER